MQQSLYVNVSTLSLTSIMLTGHHFTANPNYNKLVQKQLFLLTVTSQKSGSSTPFQTHFYSMGMVKCKRLFSSHKKISDAQNIPFAQHHNLAGTKVLKLNVCFAFNVDSINNSPLLKKNIQIFFTVICISIVYFFANLNGPVTKKNTQYPQALH